MNAEQANASGTGPSLALLKREFREDWLFLLATVALLVCTARVSPDMLLPPAGLSMVLLPVAVGLGLGVRAFAPDSANGTARFLAALPVAGKVVLAAKLAVRILAIVLGTAIAAGWAADGAAWLPSAVGAAVLFACLVGVLAGQVLDRSATAFAAGAAMLVVLARLVGDAWIDSLAAPVTPCVLTISVLSACAAVLLGLSCWLAGRP